MLHTSKKTRIFTLTVFAVALLAGALRFVKIGGFNSSKTPIGGLPSILFAFIFIAWAVFVDYRITHKEIKKYLIAIAYLMVLWMMVREAKYSFFDELPVVCRYLWYSYYISMVLLPTFLFMIALNIGKEQDKQWKWLFLPSIIFIMFVLTNDFHQWVFVFKSDFSNWDLDYSYGFMYFIVMSWVAFMGIGALVIYIKRCRIFGIKKKVWIPIIFLVICAAYMLWTCTDMFRYSQKLFQVPEMFCFLIMMPCESCIQIGLIPSNIGYDTFFKESSIQAYITDKNGHVKYASDKAIVLSTKQAIEENIFIEEKNLRFRNHDIHGGKVYWVENLRTINETTDKISEIVSQLSDYNDLLQAEIETKARILRAQEQNRLYSIILKAIEPQLNKLNEILHDATIYDEDLRLKYALACVLNAFIKRRSNLVLLSDTAEYLPGFELTSSIRESLEYIKVFGVPCSFRCNGEGVFSSTCIILAYDFFEMIVETILGKIAGLLISLSFNHRDFCLKMSFDKFGELWDRDWRKEGIAKCKGCVEIIDEEETTFISLTFQTNGGVSHDCIL